MACHFQLCITSVPATNTASLSDTNTDTSRRQSSHVGCRAAVAGDLTFDPNDNTRRRDEWARRLAGCNLLLTFKTPELLHFKTEPSIQRHKTAVSVLFGLQKNHGFGTGFDNRNNTNYDIYSKSATTMAQKSKLKLN